jgi:serine/threonine-protein kinase
MSPEQLRGTGEMDHRTDVWSLGVVAFEALTGWPPFTGDSIADLIIAISGRRHDRPSHVRSDLPRVFDAWFERALAKAPEARFQSVDEMARSFRALLAPSAQRRRGIVAIAIGVSALAIAAAGAAALVRSTSTSKAAASLNDPSAAAVPTVMPTAIAEAREAPTADAPAPAPGASASSAATAAGASATASPPGRPGRAAKPAGASRGLTNPPPQVGTTSPPPLPPPKKDPDPSEIQ